MMLDHISLAVADYERSWAFYDQVLAVLGHRRVMEITDAPEYVAAGYGASEHEPAFWIGGAREPGSPAPQPPDGQHVAFARRLAPRWMRSTRRRCGPARPTTAHPASGSTITPTTTPAS